MNILKSIIYGIIEGITEWLPISSTGHLIIFNKLLAMDVSPEFYAVYEVVIQLAAIIAVFIIFFKKIWPFGKSTHPLTEKGLLQYVKKDKFILWLKIAVSCIPAIIVGLLIDDWIDAHFYNTTVVGIALVVVGIAFIVVELAFNNKNAKIKSLADLGFNTAFIIGLFQIIAAIFPGTSRSGVIIIGALILGVSRTVAFEYTFYLAIPVMFGASILKLFKYGLAFSFNEIIILLAGCLSSFIVSVFVIKLLMDYVKKNNFIIFGIYRIALGIIILLFLR